MQIRDKPPISPPLPFFPPPPSLPPPPPPLSPVIAVNLSTTRVTEGWKARLTRCIILISLANPPYSRHHQCSHRCTGKGSKVRGSPLPGCGQHQRCQTQVSSRSTCNSFHFMRHFYVLFPVLCYGWCSIVYNRSTCNSFDFMLHFSEKFIALYPVSC